MNRGGEYENCWTDKNLHHRYFYFTNFFFKYEIWWLMLRIPTYPSFIYQNIINNTKTSLINSINYKIFSHSASQRIRIPWMLYKYIFVIFYISREIFISLNKKSFVRISVHYGDYRWRWRVYSLWYLMGKFFPRPASREMTTKRWRCVFRERR